MRKLNRSTRQWGAVSASAVSDGSRAQVKNILDDALRDISVLSKRCGVSQDAIEIPETSIIEDVMNKVAELKASTDGPNREDWQLGYAAACREVGNMLHKMKSN